MSTISTHTKHQHTISGTSSRELDRNILIPHLSDSAPAPGSTIWERIDRSTLQTIADIFPAPTLGRTFFARFLERAASEQSIIPDVTEDTVYICTQSIAKLGEELGLSNDTAQKYVKLYAALGLLRKQKFMDKLAFLLFVGIYHPPQALEGNLDFLIQKSRPRLHDMAIDVKARCRIYGLIEEDLVGSLEQLQALLHTEKGTSRRTFEQRMAQAHYITSQVLKVVLTSHLSTESTQGDGTRGRKNLPRTRALIDDTQQQQGNQESTRPDGERLTEASLFPNLPKGTSREDSPHHQRDEESTQGNQSERFFEANTSSRLPDPAYQVDSSHRSRKGESTEADTLGRFAEKHRSAKLPNSLSQVDSIHDEQKGESTQGGNRGRFPQPDASSRLPQTTGEGDSGQGNPRTPTAESPQDGKPGRREDDHLGQNLPNLSHQGDSGNVSRNVHVDNIYNFITSTLREPQRVAEFLAEQLEGDRRVYPKYQKLFHTQEGQVRDPHVLAAAFICTMVRLHRDRWNISSHPGGFFTKRCREYDAGVPKEVEGWIASYGQLSPESLLETLAKQRQSGRAPVLAAPVQPPSSQKPAPKPLQPPLALSPQLQVEPTRMVMSKREAQDLVELVARDRRTQLFRTKRVRLGKQTPRYAVLVDASIPGGPPHQTVVYSRAEWQDRLDRMKTWRDLIYPPPSGPPGADAGRPKPGEETRQ